MEVAGLYKGGRIVPGEGIPEIKWGTFHDEEGVAHVAPVCGDEYLMKGHILSMSCACGPTLDRHPKVNIVVHYVIH